MKLSLSSLLTSSVFFCATTASAVDTQKLLRGAVELASDSKYNLDSTDSSLTTDDLYGTLSSTTAPAPGFNAEGGSVFTNFVNAFNDKQFFALGTGTSVHEKPGSEPMQDTAFYWCGDLTFSDFNNNTSLMGYAGRCVGMMLTGYADAIAAGATVPKGQFDLTLGISAVFVEQLNIFEGQYHLDTITDFAVRYWDDGRRTMPGIIWEGHDEGDMAPNFATKSESQFAEGTWMSVEEVAQLFNTSTDEFAPDKFKQVYKETWIKEHEFEAAADNPNSEAELKIIEKVKNETDSFR